MKNIINEGNLYNPNFLDVFNITDELGSTLEIMHDSAITTTLIDVKNHLVNPQFDADYVAINFAITEISVDGGVTLIPGTGDKTVLSGVWTKVDDFFIKIIYDNINLNVYTVVPDNFVVKMTGFRAVSTNIKVSDYFISETPVIPVDPVNEVTEQTFLMNLAYGINYPLNSFHNVASFELPNGRRPTEINVELFMQTKSGGLLPCEIVSLDAQETHTLLYNANETFKAVIYSESESIGYHPVIPSGKNFRFLVTIYNNIATINIMFLTSLGTESSGYISNYANDTSTDSASKYACDYFKFTALYGEA